MRWSLAIAAGTVTLAMGGLLAWGGRPAPSVVAASAAVTRRPEPAVPGALQRTLRHLVEEVRTESDGALVVSNEHYRAAFSKTGGIAVTPRIERTLAAPLTWRYRVRAVETSTMQRRLEPVAPAISRTGAHVVDFERPGIIERYAGERTGVEQIFVLTERPQGAGDVRIVGDVHFDGRAASADGGVAFTAEGRAPFTYSKPIAFDADRRPLPVHVELSGSQLALVLDDAGLADARWPVTIDPLYGVVTAETSEFGAFGADVAYNPDLGEFLVVYSAFTDNVFGPSGEIRARRYLEQGDPIGGPISVSTGHVENGARVAYDFHSDVYLAVWERQTASGDAPRGACGRRLSTVGAPLGDVMCLSNSSYIKSRGLDVAARNQREHAPSEASFMVVWIDSGAAAVPKVVKRELVTGTGVQLGEAQISPEDASYSSVSYDPANDRFFITWNSVGVNEVKGRTLSPSGSASAVITIGANGSQAQHAYDPVSRRYLVAWRTPAAGSTSTLVGRVYHALSTPAPATGVVTLKAPASGAVLPLSIASEQGEFMVDYGTTVGKQINHLAVSPDGVIWNEMFVDYDRNPDDRGGIAIGQHGFIAGVHARYDTPSAEWYLRYSNTGRRIARYVHGSSGDYDGDGRSDLFLYQLANATWWVKTQTTTFGIGFDATGAIPVLLDWDGDGLADLATFNTATGQWRIRLTATSAIETRSLGRGGDIPVPGDYAGDARDEIGVFRPSTGEWRLLGHDDASPTVTTFGQVGDQPTPADWDGDGKTELGVWRGSTNTWLAREVGGASLASVVWAGPGIPLQGNFVGNSRADQAFFQHHLGVWTIRDGQTGAVTTVDPGIGVWGVTMPLDWDGDGRLNVAWYSSEGQKWFVIDAASHVEPIDFGHLGDIPAGAR